jgi:hypothetical protein
MYFPSQRLWLSSCVLACVLAAIPATADEPKATPANTISVEVTEPVKPQTFPRPFKFVIADVIDRSGNAQPMLVYKPRGGIFLDRTPVEVVRGGLTSSLKAADMLAVDRDSADFLMNVYLFNFGLSSSSGLDFFGKVEFAVQLKNPKTGKSQQVTASGTSIGGGAARKKNLQKNIQDDLEHALIDALRNLLRGEKLRDALATLDVAPEPQRAEQNSKPQSDIKPR